MLVLLGSLLLVAGAALARAEVAQQGNLRITVSSQISPVKLPRADPAPIAVFVAGHIATADGSTPPQLRRMTIKINRHGLLQSAGLPVCRLDQIQTASTQRALADCGHALVGSGRFWAQVVLPDQPPYPTFGRLLVFNGREHGRPALLAHIFTSHPFFTSFVIAFRLRRLSGGPYGTELSASLPQALGDWGYVNRIKMTLRRKYRYRGREHSYFNAACPAPKGTKTAVFPLALVDFYFAGHLQLATTVQKSCRVQG